MENQNTRTKNIKISLEGRTIENRIPKHGKFDPKDIEDSN